MFDVATYEKKKIRPQETGEKKPEIQETVTVIKIGRSSNSENQVS